MKIESLLSNPMVKNILFGTLRKFANEHGIRGITIKIDEQGNIDENFELHKEPVVVMKKTDYDNLLKSIQQ